MEKGEEEEEEEEGRCLICTSPSTQPASLRWGGEGPSPGMAAHGCPWQQRRHSLLQRSRTS